MAAVIQNLKSIAFFTVFTGGYAASLQKARSNKSEIVRLGAAGSISCMACETVFYFVDTLNMRSKVSTHSISVRRLISHIIRTEGVRGFFKGASAAYYGSLFYGFSYFSIYKAVK
jgi:hypothetical protein